MMTNRPTFGNFKDEALKNREVAAAYDELAPAYAMKRDMIAMRKAKGFTQQDMADLLGTKKSNISRLESVNSDSSPRLATIEENAPVLGYRLGIAFEANSARP